MDVPVFAMTFLGAISASCLYLLTVFVLWPRLKGWIDNRRPRHLCTDCRWCMETTELSTYYRCAHPQHIEQSGDYVTGFFPKMRPCLMFNEDGLCRKFEAVLPGTEE